MSYLKSLEKLIDAISQRARPKKRPAPISRKSRPKLHPVAPVAAATPEPAPQPKEIVVPAETVAPPAPVPHLEPRPKRKYVRRRVAAVVVSRAGYDHDVLADPTRTEVQRQAHLERDQARDAYEQALNTEKDQLIQDKFNAWIAAIERVNEVDPAYYLGKNPPLEPMVLEPFTPLPVFTSVRTCRVCGCTDDDCRGCIERTGMPCSWVEADLCSACVTVPKGVV